MRRNGKLRRRRRSSFGNDSFSGAYVAVYDDAGEPHGGHDCRIDGVTCYADEAHMGGIVIQVVG